jgi:hypothetical protein
MIIFPGFLNEFRLAFILVLQLLKLSNANWLYDYLEEA